MAREGEGVLNQQRFRSVKAAAHSRVQLRHHEVHMPVGLSYPLKPEPHTDHSSPGHVLMQCKAGQQHQLCSIGMPLP